MDKSDKIIFWFGTFLVLGTIPTWFKTGWYWFDISTATIIAASILCISFVAKEWFLEYFFIYIYYIKLTNIISHYANYGANRFKDSAILETQLRLLNYSKPVLVIVLYVWFSFVFTKYIKGWKQY